MSLTCVIEVLFTCVSEAVYYPLLNISWIDQHVEMPSFFYYTLENLVALEATRYQDAYI